MRRLLHRYVEFPLFKLLGLRGRAQDIVEVGCGTGYGAVLLSTLCPKNYVGIDLMPEMIALAKNQPGLANAEFLVMDAAEMSVFPDHSKDVVVIFDITTQGNSDPWLLWIERTCDDGDDDKIMTPQYPWLGLFAFLVVCSAAAGIGGAVTTPKIATWYATLVKPSWNLPNWVFGRVWSALYFCMAVAAWLVWRQGGFTDARMPLVLFGVQLAVNVLWSCIFFGLQRPGLAFAEVLLLWAAIAATTVMFWFRSTVAGILFVPYLARVSFASVLNFTIWRLNA